MSELPPTSIGITDVPVPAAKRPWQIMAPLSHCVHTASVLGRQKTGKIMQILLGRANSAVSHGRNQWKSVITLQQHTRQGERALCPHVTAALRVAAKHVIVRRWLPGHVAPLVHDGRATRVMQHPAFSAQQPASATPPRGRLRNTGGTMQ